jgi:hypothetical protein
MAQIPSTLVPLSAHRNVLDDLAHLVSQKEIVQGEELREMLGKTTDESSQVPQPVQIDRV